MIEADKFFFFFLMINESYKHISSQNQNNKFYIALKCGMIQGLLNLVFWGVVTLITWQLNVTKMSHESAVFFLFFLYF